MMQRKKLVAGWSLPNSLGVGFSWIIIGILVTPPVLAQPPFGGGDRGSRGGDRGGFGDRGGPPGGFGGDRGGPPGGFGGDRGGPPGGFGGGPPSGFDPTEFLGRMDRNGNGQIDPDEQEGPASFIIRRLESVDPKIRAGEPISIKRITNAIEDMRAGRSGDSGSSRDDGRNSGSSRSSSDASMTLEPLVPGFESLVETMPLPGFGPAAERMSVIPTDSDIRDARQALERYDRNRDGQLDQKEISEGRFRGNPLDFDRNGDKKMSESELAVRAAIRRESENEGQSSDRRDKDRRDQKQSTSPLEVDFEGRRSYRVYPANSPEGLPNFFTERDLNRDGQVAMSEYSSDWNDARIDEYYQWDVNGDGVITVSEVRAGVDRGTVASDGPAGTAPAASTMMSVSDSSASTSSSATASSASPATKAPANLPPPSEKSLSYAKRILGRYDANSDGALTATEWKDMLLSPAPADANGDGRVTIIEYAQYTEFRSRK